MQTTKKFTLTLLLCFALSACTTWSGTPINSQPNRNNETGSIDSAQQTRQRPIVNSVSGSSSIISSNNVEDFYVVFGQRYAVMKNAIGFSESGVASWYGDPFHGQKTSNGEVYNMHAMTAAHKHLPLPSFVEVTRIETGQSIIVRVNDRGPFKNDRVIDLSFAAAKALNMINAGTAKVNIRALDDLNADPAVQDQRVNARPIFVQVGSYNELSNAQNIRRKLIQNNINNSRITTIKNGLRSPLFRLQIGPISKGSDYDHLIERLHKIGLQETVIIRQ